GVADAAQQAGIGKGALEGMVLASERVREARQVGVENLEPARTGVGEGGCGPARCEERGRAWAGAGFGEQQGAGRKVEGDKPALGRCAGAWRTPVQAPGDHEVQDEEQLVFERDDEALAETAKTDDVLAVRG